LPTERQQQPTTLVGPFHWVIQVLHLLLGVLASGLAKSARCGIGRPQLLALPTSQATIRCTHPLIGA
jgi:hypothetical protein